MKAEDKPKRIEEYRGLMDSIDIEYLSSNPNDLKEIGKINRLIAIFTNFSSDSGQELRRLFLEFQRCARRSTRKGHIQNRAVDMMQFIGQGIEEMDLYVIDEPIKDKQQKIINSLKGEKLWVRSSLEDNNLHLLIGEREDDSGGHVHLISDSKTGEMRIDAGDKLPGDLLERVVSITTKNGATVGVTQKGVKTTLEFFDENLSDATEANITEMPIPYVLNGMGRTGGPQGHSETFTIKNIGKVIALDVNWGIRGFNYEWRSDNEAFELEPGQEKEVVFQISGEKIFTKEVPELNIIMEFKDIKGNSYFARRELEQVKVSSGDFFNLRPSSYHQPVLLVNDGLDLISNPIHDGDRVEAEFKIDTREGEKRAKIGLSGSLIAVLDLEEAQLKQAILELGHRKIRKMVKDNNIRDYLFTTQDLPEKPDGGFKTYVLLRDSI